MIYDAMVYNELTDVDAAPGRAAARVKLRNLRQTPAPVLS
jgi:hypothetical protein